MPLLRPAHELTPGATAADWHCRQPPGPDADAAETRHSDSDTAVPQRLAGVPPLRQVHPLPPKVTAADWHRRQPTVTAAERRHQPYEEELLAVFRMIDQDENGVIDFSELLDLGKAVNAAFTAAKCRAVLGWMDEDHDGTVTKEEFVAFFGKLMKKFSQSANDRVEVVCFLGSHPKIKQGQVPV